MSDVTYEEYMKAKKFAQWKYKYGLFVLIACWICLVIIIVLIIIYAKELSMHYAIYTIEKLGVDFCQCYNPEGMYYINSTSISYADIL